MNHWHHLHMERSGDDAVEREISEQEHAQHPPKKCGKCGDEAHYRMTVGAYQCPSCRALEVHRRVEYEDGSVMFFPEWQEW